MSKEMTPKEATQMIQDNITPRTLGILTVEFNVVEKALDRLELLEKENRVLLMAIENKNNEIKNLKKLIHDNPYKKAIEFLKDTFEIYLDSKLRISDGTDCIQAFPIDLKTNEVLYDLLKEVLLNE